MNSRMKFDLFKLTVNQTKKKTNQYINMYKDYFLTGKNLYILIVNL